MPGPVDASRAFAAAISGGDAERALACLTADACFVTREGEVLQGHEAIRAVVAGLAGAGARMTVEVERLVEAGAVAAAHLHWELDDRPDHGGRSLVVYARDGEDAWRIAVDAPFGL